VEIFYDAVNARSDNERIDQSIPVFKALIASDIGDRFHRNHGELGHALKTKSKPDWAGAEQAFTKAIEVRDRIGDTGFADYEFSRAWCRISLDRPKEEIIADFKKAAQDDWWRHYELDDTYEWFQTNNVKADDLGFQKPQDGDQLE
jgi:hypothetical protein